jgi:hypothetical protein
MYNAAFFAEIARPGQARRRDRRDGHIYFHTTEMLC